MPACPGVVDCINAIDDVAPRAPI
jgi:hypothetical protein